MSKKPSLTGPELPPTYLIHFNSWAHTRVYMICNVFSPSHMSEQKNFLQFALYHASLDFFLEDFTLWSQDRMDLLNSLQVKSSEKFFKYKFWSTVNGATLCFKREIFVVRGWQFITYHINPGPHYFLKGWDTTNLRFWRNLGPSLLSHGGFSDPWDM